MDGAIAVFVKTPGLSPLKTRLGHSLGREEALAFHCLAAKATEKIVQSALSGQTTFYWAVAEQEGLDHDLWKEANRIFQGDGGLGKRLSRVYDELRQKHGFVIFLGADSPQLDPLVLRSAISLLREGKPWVLGPSEDGGFYLFGGSRPLATSCWEKIPYSTSDTASELRKELSFLGEPALLPLLWDIDHQEDFFRCYEYFQGRPQESLLPEQRELAGWMGDIVKKVNSLWTLDNRP